MLDEQKNLLMNELKNSQTEESEEQEYIIKERDKRFKEYNKLVIIFAIAFLFVLFFALDYLKYTNLISGTSTLSEDKQFEEDFKDKKNQYLSWMWIENQKWINDELTVNFDATSGDVIKNTIVEYVNNLDIPYAEKKENTEKALTSLASKLKENDTVIEKINTDIWTYWFLPKDLNDIVSDSSIQRSILSVEWIKFYTAMDIFSRLPSFRESLSTMIWDTPDKIKSSLTYFLSKWDTDIQKYVDYCYLNPYETSWDCPEFNDFDNYYNRLKASKEDNGYKTFNTTVFKRVIYYIEQKLEYEKPAKLAIVMNSLDPVKNSIQFTVSINTLKDDENKLFQEWMTSPHIDIVSLFVSLLRESYLILWSKTDFNDVTVNEQKDTIWNQQISFNNSKFEFDVPVQKSVEREIYDYVYK